MTMAVRPGIAPADGADLYYEVRGDGPPLLMITGGGGDAGFYAATGTILAERFTVISYDRRGNSRSRLHRPAAGPGYRMSVSQQAADAIAVLAACGARTAGVFGNSGGAIIALDLAAHHPQAVTAVVAHEPPVLRALPDAPALLALYDEVDALLETDGWQAAFARFQDGIGPIAPGRAGLLTSLVSAAKLLGSGAMMEILTRMSANWEFLTRYELRSFVEYEPDLDKIVASQVPIAVGHGVATGDPLALRMTQSVAAQLGIECGEFPGGHAAPLEVPVKFAAALLSLLDQL
jgi:pimeloyl-ACP methyl ester carboxylesterase